MKHLVAALALLASSCVHGSTWEDFGLAATEGVIGGITYAVGERLLQPSASSSSADGGVP